MLGGIGLAPAAGLAGKIVAGRFPNDRKGQRGWCARRAGWPEDSGRQGDAGASSSKVLNGRGNYGGGGGAIGDRRRAVDGRKGFGNEGAIGSGFFVQAEEILALARPRALRAGATARPAQAGGIHGRAGHERAYSGSAARWHCRWEPAERCWRSFIDSAVGLEALSVRRGFDRGREKLGSSRGARTTGAAGRENVGSTRSTGAGRKLPEPAGAAARSSRLSSPLRPAKVVPPKTSDPEEANRRGRGCVFMGRETSATVRERGRYRSGRGWATLPRCACD